MEGLYHEAGITRQGFHYHLLEREHDVEVTRRVCEIAHAVRNDEKLPGMGCRQIYSFARQHPNKYSIPAGVGRDKFEEIALANGYRLVINRAYHKTTRWGDYYFENKIEGRSINNINQVWVSDITYYEVYQNGVKTFFYITIILDLYSRVVLAAVASKSLKADCTVVAALKAAYKYRGIDNDTKIPDLYFHSDRGGQYIYKKFLKMLEGNNIQSSMAEEVYENAFAERINGTIKNDFLFRWNVNSFRELVDKLPDAVFSYNNRKPHQALKGDTPANFEKRLKDLPLCQRTLLNIKSVEKAHPVVIIKNEHFSQNIQ